MSKKPGAVTFGLCSCEGRGVTFDDDEGGGGGLSFFECCWVVERRVSLRRVSPLLRELIPRTINN